MKKIPCLLLTLLAPFAAATAAQPSSLIPVPREDAWWRERHAQKLEEARKGDFELVLIGDSITHRWENEGGDAYAGITSRYRTLNLGFSGDRTQEVLWRLENGELDGLHPKRLVLLIGTNNLLPEGSTPEETVAGIKKIVAMIRQKLPETTILLHAILPRGQSSGDPFRKTIADTNRGISAIAGESQISYVNIGSLFLDRKTGDAKKELLWDFLHLSTAGYGKWAPVLLEKLSASDTGQPEKR